MMPEWPEVPRPPKKAKRRRRLRGLHLRPARMFGCDRRYAAACVAAAGRLFQDGRFLVCEHFARMHNGANL